MSEQDEERLARKIADKLMARIYQEIGESVAKKLFWVLVAAAIAFAAFTGMIHLPKVGG